MILLRRLRAKVSTRQGFWRIGLLGNWGVEGFVGGVVVVVVVVVVGLHNEDDEEKKEERRGVRESFRVK